MNKLAFPYLNEDMIKELIPKVGRRAIFRHKYIEFKRKENKLVRIESFCCFWLHVPCMRVHTKTSLFTFLYITVHFGDDRENAFCIVVGK